MSTDFEVNPVGTQEQIRQLKDALVVAVEALEEHVGSDDSDTLTWLKSQVEKLV